MEGKLMGKWKVTGKMIRGAERDIVYECADVPGVTITSEKRDIPHANRPGAWSHTDYVVRGEAMAGPIEIKCISLKEAKAYAEQFGKEG